MDARFTMVVFVILTAVAGFVGYTRVYIAREATLARELTELNQAFETLQADLGTFLYFAINQPDGERDFKAIFDKSVLLPGFQSSWHGPYYQPETTKHATYGFFKIFYAQGDRTSACNIRSECYVWISLSNVPQKIWEGVDANLDSAGLKNDRDSENRGRVQSDTLNDPRTLFLRSAPRPRML